MPHPTSQRSAARLPNATLLLSLWLGLLASLGSACVSVRPHGAPATEAAPPVGRLLVYVAEGALGAEQAERFAGALREALKDRELDARLVVVGPAQLADEATLAESRTDRDTLLRVTPVAGTWLVGRVARVTYVATLTRLNDEQRLWRASFEGRCGALAGQLRRRDRRLARALLDALVGRTS